MFKLLSFKIASTMAAALCGFLCLTLLLIPDLIYWLFDLVASNTSNLLAKRAAMLFLGFVTLLVMARNTRNQEVVSAVSFSMITAFAGLVVVGIYEYVAGVAGPGIWLAIAGEAFFIILFVFAWINHKNNEKS